MSGPNRPTINQTFGFHPSHAVNPVSPSISGQFENDGSLPYDVSITKSLSLSQFGNIITYIKNIGTPTYNLNTKNCTDIGLQIFSQTNTSLPDTSGSWPGGSGSNPGNLGQDVRASNISNTTKNTSGGTAPTSHGGC